MPANLLLVAQDGDNLRISGILDASDDMRTLLGTLEPADTPIELEKMAAADIEKGVIEAVRSGREVMGGYIRFTRPVIIKDAKMPAELLAKFKGKKKDGDKKEKEEEEGNPCPKKADITVDNEFLDQLREVADLAVADDLTKAAACPFVENLLAAMEDLKVDGTEVGLTAPVKVAFPDEKTRDFFLGLFKNNKKAALDAGKLADVLVSSGAVKSGLVEKLAEMGKKAHNTP